MVIGRLKTETSELLGSNYFYPRTDIELLGMIHDRERGLPDMYLARKMKYLKTGLGNSWAAIKHTVREISEGIGKYESYNGLSLSSYAETEKEYTWLDKEAVDILMTQAAIAQRTLQKWHD